MTGFSIPLVIELGINAPDKRDAKRFVEKEIMPIIKIKLGEYLEQFPNQVYVQQTYSFDEFKFKWFRRYFKIKKD